MAREFLASHGVDIDHVISQVQDGSPGKIENYRRQALSRIFGARLPHKPRDTLWDVSIASGCISGIEEHDPFMCRRVGHVPGVLEAGGSLLAPSLCHAHVHLDKCFLLDDPRYADLEIATGDFAEAMSLTGQAKSRFEEQDLLRRGRRLIRQSIDAGVTAMRAFVEVDEVVEMKCLDAGLKLKDEFEGLCAIQICAFAQLAVFSGEDGGSRNRALMEKALERPGVDVIGSTPYVESSMINQKKNIAWAIERALASGKHLDFHLDYNLDSDIEPLVWDVLRELKRQQWNCQQTICLGHCTRLTLFSRDEWQKLKADIGNLPVSFVGLPTSDLFMMARPQGDGGGSRARGTLQVPEMVQRYGLNAAVSMNNVGNAFTPQGNCDPLSLASLGVGIYQAGTVRDADVLFDSVSRRAKEGIGCSAVPLELQVGNRADLVLVQSPSIASACHLAPPGRMTVFNGVLLAPAGSEI